MAVLASSILAWASAAGEPVPHDATERCAEVVDRPHTLRVHVAPGGIEEPVSELLRAEVEAIWRPYNVTIVWMSSSWASHSGTSPPDLWVQFVEQRLVPARMRDHQAVAWIPFVAGVPQHYIRVSLPAVEASLQTRSWWDGRPLSAAPPKVQQEVLGRVIGRAVAHEMGHYVLASRVHRKAGLMRAVLSHDDLVRPGGAHRFTLEESDARALRAGRLASCLALAGVQSAGRP